jgi:hypothetical protein
MWWHLISHFLMHETKAAETAHTIRVVHCEACGRCYAYELKRTGRGAANTLFGGGSSVASQRAAEDLQRLLSIGIEVVPCPSCGWYQSNMVPKARKLHRRWMLKVGQYLTIALIPVAVLGVLINGINEGNGRPSIPWPILGVTLAGLFVVSIGMMAGKLVLARGYDPNDADVEARILYGQSRAFLLSEQEARDLEASPESLFDDADKAEPRP